VDDGKRVGKITSDGEKIEVQLYFYEEEFVRCVREVGIDSGLVDGVLLFSCRSCDSA